jgi:CBS domain-containing protein
MPGRRLRRDPAARAAARVGGPAPRPHLGCIPGGDRHEGASMRVEELMSDAKCCRESDTANDCAKLMRDDNIGFVPICDQAQKPIGAITDRDLTIRVLAEGRSADQQLGGIMTRDVISCRTGDDADQVARLMRDHRKSRVMVCDDQGKLVGVVSLQDLAEAASEEEAGETLQEVKSGEPDQPAAH